MNKLIILIFTILLACSENLIEQNENNHSFETKTIQHSPLIENYYPIPSIPQLEWQNDKLLAFFHFGINTFTSKEWGTGKEDPLLFNPIDLDTDQWIKIIKDAGFKHAIITAKHHDGFCLWPSKFTKHSIKNSPYKNGNGDIVKEFAESCNKYGIKFGFYLSPWDRHESTYGTNEYNDYYVNQLEELLTKYGNVGEVWLDGANGEGPNGKKQNYDWNRYFNTIKGLQPNTLIAINGPDIRWIKNEKGISNEEEWSIQPKRYDQQIDFNGKVWYPSESDVSIRPGWFFKEFENQSVKTVTELINIYFSSVGRNSNLLLNIPPNKRGLIEDIDIKIISDWRKKINNIFGNNLLLNSEISVSNVRDEDLYSKINIIDNNIESFWVTDKNIHSAEVIFELKELKLFNTIKLEEKIKFGQRIKKFSIDVFIDNKWVKVFKGTTIGRTRIIDIKPVFTDRIRINIEESNASPTLRFVGAYYYN